MLTFHQTHQSQRCRAPHPAPRRRPVREALADAFTAYRVSWVYLPVRADAATVPVTTRDW